MPVFFEEGACAGVIYGKGPIIAFGGEEEVRCFEGVRRSEGLQDCGAWRVCVFR